MAHQTLYGGTQPWYTRLSHPAGLVLCYNKVTATTKVILEGKVAAIEDDSQLEGEDSVAAAMAMGIVGMAVTKDTTTIRPAQEKGITEVGMAEDRVITIRLHPFVIGVGKQGTWLIGVPSNKAQNSKKLTPLTFRNQFSLLEDLGVPVSTSTAHCIATQPPEALYNQYDLQATIGNLEHSKLEGAKLRQHQEATKGKKRTRKRRRKTNKHTKAK